jgi:hypothetical protein
MRPRPTHLSAAGTHPVQCHGPHPALTMMAGLSSGSLVLSVQFVGRYFAEATLFQVARAWERAAGTNQPRSIKAVKATSRSGNRRSERLPGPHLRRAVRAGADDRVMR